MEPPPLELDRQRAIAADDQVTDVAFPAAAGARLPWADLPRQVRAAVEGWLGSSVEAANRPSGFSPGVAALLRTEDGREVFLKAVGPVPNPFSPAMHRREAVVVAALPADLLAAGGESRSPRPPKSGGRTLSPQPLASAESLPVSVPRLLWTFDEGEGGWVALAFTAIAGTHPVMPWRAAELARVVEALIGLSDALTPSPVPVATVGLATDWGVVTTGWWRLIAADRSPRLDAWSVDHLPELIALEAGAADAVRGETFLHLDVRADNLLLTPDAVVLVDWPHARIGAAWLDLACAASAVAMQGGPPPEELLAKHPAARAADPAAITAAVAAIAGYFTYNALQPDPPGLPTLRAFGAAQGVVARRWLAERAGLT